MIHKYFFSVFFLFSVQFVFSQIGNEFWFAAPDLQVRHGDDPIILRISTHGEDAKVIISQPSNNAFKKIEVTVPKNSSYSIDLTKFKHIIECDSINKPQNRGLFIQSSCKISCYYDIADALNGDLFSLKGINSLGEKFTVPQQMSLSSWNYPLYTSNFIIVATEDSTTVKVYPTKDLAGQGSKKEIIIVLDKGQTYSFENISKIPNQRAGGTIVLSNKPIAITIKDDSIQLPGYGCADTAGDQLIPDDLAGNEFAIMKGYFFSSDRYFIFPIEDSTKVYVNGILKKILNKGDYYEGILNENACFVNTSFPVQIFHISGFGCEIGGAILPGLSCTGSNVVNVNRATNQDFFINIITKKENINDFYFNGLPNIIRALDFVEVNGSDGSWMVYRKNIPLSQLKAGQTASVSNKVGRFHLGIIHGDEGSTTRYGYFSDFSNTTIVFENIEESVCDALSSYCYGASIQLNPKIDKSSSYFWEGPNKFYSKDLNLNIPSFSEKDEGYYTFTVIGGSCGVSKKRIYLTKPEVNPLVADFNVNQAVQCFGNNLFEFQDKSISANASDINKRQWVIAGDKKNYTEVFKTSFKDTGLYIIGLLIEDVNNCRDTIEKYVRILANPRIDLKINGKPAFCAGDSSVLSISSSEVDNLNEIKWFKDNVVWDSIDTYITVKQVGNYQVMISNKDGCATISDQFPFEVYDNPTISLLKPLSYFICDSVQVTLNAVTSGLVNWYFNGQPIVGATSSQLKVHRGGVYEVKAVSSKGCMTLSDTKIILNNINVPKPDFSFINSCVQVPVTFLNETKGEDNYQYIWDFGDGTGVSFNKSPVHSFQKSGLFNVSLSIEIEECPEQVPIKSKKIQVEQPIAGIRYPVMNVSKNYPQSLFARKFGVTYDWKPSVDLKGWNAYNPIYNSKMNQEFLIDIYTANKCKTTDTLQVNVFEKTDIMVPEAFTPNNDGVNDQLIFYNIGITKLKYFRIFNRWGQLLFETTNENSYWDGTFNGVLQPIDSYVWMVEGVGSDGGTFNKRGQSILIR